MGRKAIQVSKDLLTETIEACESTGSYPNQSKLFKDVANIIAGKLSLPKVPSPAFVYTQVSKYGIAVKTPKGRQGIAPGGLPRVQGERKTRQERLSAHPASKLALGQLRAEILKEKNGKFLPIFKRFERGSLKAAIQLKCIECANYQPNEIRHCPCTNCPLYLVRPYQATNTEGADTAELD